jgi:peroxiredoxin
MRMLRSGWSARVAGVVLAGLSCWGPDVEGAEVPTLELGVTAPDFELPGIDGKTHRLSDFGSAKLLLIVFTANHCPTAQSYEDRLIDIARDYAGKGVAVVAISPNDPRAVRLDEMGYTDLGDTLEEMKQRAVHKGFNFPYLYDGDEQKTARAYGPVATPHVFIFDAERKLRFVGRVDSTEEGVSASTVPSTRNALDELLAGRPVSEPKTKVFGCSIKWSDKRDSVRQSDQEWAQREVSLETIDAPGVTALARNDAGKLRLVNVWATWCGPCATEFPELVKIERSYRNRGFELVTVSADGPGKKEKVHAFLKEQQAAVRNLLFDSDDQYALIEALDPKWQGALPYTLLVRPGGEVVYRYEGAFDALELKRAIVSVLGREKDW